MKEYKIEASFVADGRQIPSQLVLVCDPQEDADLPFELRDDGNELKALMSRSELVGLIMSGVTAVADLDGTHPAEVLRLIITTMAVEPAATKTQTKP